MRSTVDLLQLLNAATIRATGSDPRRSLPPLPPPITNPKEAEMAVFHRHAAPCRNPKCNRTVRSNGFTVYCWSCTALDIRYGDPGSAASPRRL
jgi:hypothetical protein